MSYIRNRSMYFIDASPIFYVTDDMGYSVAVIPERWAYSVQGTGEQHPFIVRPARRSL